MMSHGLWQRRFASDPGLVGRTLNMNGRPYQVIGIAPPDFKDPQQPEAEMWAALSFTNQQLMQRGSHGLLVIARIRPELTLEQARSDMARVSERIIEGAPRISVRQVRVSAFSSTRCSRSMSATSGPR